MRKIFTIIALFFFYNVMSFGQTTIAFQSFEGGSSDTWNYNAQPSAFDENSHSDVWAVCDNLASISGPSDGTYFWGIRDLNCPTNTSGVGNLDFDAIDISGYTDVTLTFKYYSHGFDSSDSLLYQVQDNNGSDWPPSDYVECNKSTDAWTIVTINVPAGVTYVRLRLRANQNGGSDEAAWDEIKLSGTSSGAVANPSNFSASPSSPSQMDISWTKNTSNDNVLLAYNTTDSFGTPTDGTAYSAGDNIGSATVIYNGANPGYTHTGLDENTTYYYRAWSVDGSVNYSSGVSTNGLTLKSEPSAYPTNFTATASSASQINLSWTDAAAGSGKDNEPDGYLIRANTTGTFSDPVDGTDEADDTNADGGTVNVSQHIGSYSWSGLNASTHYYFKIWSYTNTGSHIDYLTSGTPPTASATTDAAASVPNLVISEIMQNPSDVADDKGEWFEIYNAESNDVNIDGYIIKDNGSDSHTIDNGGSLIVSSGGFIVLGINSDNATNGGLTVDYQYNGFSLGNSDDEVILVYSDGTTIVDKVEYDNGSTFPDPSGASMVLKDLTADNNVGSNWTTSTQREGSYDGSGSDKGSPGVLGSDAALPVELTSFTANVKGNKVELNWATATEVNNYGFEILRSTENSGWTTIGFVEGHGSSNSPKYYSYVDNPIDKGRYSYKLKQTDLDGTFKYSDVVSVDLGSVTKFALKQNYPNPFNPTTEISFDVPKESNVMLSVYNSLGQKVADLLNEKLSAGTHRVKFDGSKLASGIYFYKMESGGYTDIKKMILMK